MSGNEWRPKAGEEVMVRASVSRDGMADGRICVRMADGNHHWLAPRNLSPLPTPTPREPWDVLREAVDILGVHFPQVRNVLRTEAALLEAAARPKPLPTLAEVLDKTREFIEQEFRRADLAPQGEWLDPDARPIHSMICGALAREEAAKEAGQ